ncbi:MAG: glycosyltransferase [Anaerolineales bacterium]|nr:glycosyltransferase [Anaerolineales bacterium]
MNLAIVIPVHNGATTLPRCLAALQASTRAPEELIIVDDASTDGSVEIARASGARVIALTGAPRGAAFARNRGAEQARGDVLVFVDADVAVHVDTLVRIERALASNPSVAAVFGSYDDDPAERDLFSLYKNLLHHFVHQHGKRTATTFWTGCGAIRREVFFALGGLDEEWMMMQDVELGARLWRARQRVWLCPEIQAKHLKRWAPGNFLKTEIFGRAIPWTRLILRERDLPSDLNLDPRNRASAILAWAIFAGAVLGFWSAWLWIVLLVALGALIALNAELYRLFARRGGIAFTIGAIGLHLLYFLYSSAVFGGMVIAHRLRHATRFATPRQILGLLLVITLFKGWLWSGVIPMWQANDEDQHFGYAQEIVRQGTLAVAVPEQVPLERVLLWNMISPLRLSAQREPFDLSSEGVAQLVQFKRQLDTPEARATLVPPIWFPRFVKQHPPLYYAAQAVVHQIVSAQNILARMMWMRWFSVLMGTATVFCAYGAARAVWQEQKWLPLLVATLVSFHPLFTFFTSVVSNAALEYLCFGALVWVTALIVRCGMNGRRGMMLGIVLAAGLLTHSSFVAAISLVAALGLYDLWRQRGKTRWGAWSAAAILPLALAGWWYRDFLFTGGASFVEVYKTQPIAERSVSLVERFFNPGWLAQSYFFLHEWWGVFGWRDTFFPTTIYRVLDVLTLLAFVGLIALGARRLREARTTSTRGDQFAMLVGVGATLAVLAFYAMLDYRMAMVGGGYKIQGRYLLAPMVAQAMLLVAGWRQFLRLRGLVALTLAMIALNIFALVGVLVPRYYGEQIVAHYAPSDAQAQLTRGALAQRALQIETEWSRVDVWLARRASPVIFAARAGRAVTRVIEPAQMMLPYPTMLHFDPLPTGDYVFSAQSEDGQIALAVDHQIALKIFRRASPREIVERLTLAQSVLYDAWMFWSMALVNLFGVVGLIMMLMRIAVDNC